VWPGVPQARVGDRYNFEVARAAVHRQAVPSRRGDLYFAYLLAQYRGLPIVA
jgi:hypothetical protein